MNRELKNLEGHIIIINMNSKVDTASSQVFVVKMVLKRLLIFAGLSTAWLKLLVPVM